MRIFIYILAFLMTFSVYAEAEEVSSTPKKKFFDFSKYTTVEWEGDEEEAEFDVEASAAQISVDTRRPKIADLRKSRQELFQRYKMDKDVVEGDISTVSMKLKEQKDDIKQSNELNQQLSELRKKKAKMLAEFKEKNTAMLQEINILQGRNIVEEIDEESEKEIVKPVKIKEPPLSIREKLKKQRQTSSRKSKFKRKPVKRMPVVGRPGSSNSSSSKSSSKKSYIKKKERPDVRTMQKSKSKGSKARSSLLDKLKRR